VTAATYAFAQLLRVLPRTHITRAVGRLCELELPPVLSRAVVGAYVRAYQVDLDEAEPLNGRGAYPSFDAFFTRRLRDGA
jgi:phosphatidylserine decarboxylase